jgi:sugar phosphate isomerase/epimerase
MHRRHFVKYGALGLASLASARSWAAAMPAGEKLRNFGLQLSTVTPLMQKDFEGTLARVAEIGYRQVEFSAMGFLGRPANYVQSLLRKNELAAPVGRITPRLPDDFFTLPLKQAMAVYRQQGALEFFLDNVKYSLDVALSMEQKFLNLPAFMPDHFATLNGVKRVVELLNEAGEICAKEGVLFGYHNHDWEFAEVDGVNPFEYMLENTQAGKVGYQLDVYWVAKAGGNALDVMARHAGRFPSLHLKDIDSAGDFTDVGYGEIDFPSVVRDALAQGTQHFFVERDNPPDPESSITRSFGYLDKMTF